MLDFGKTEVKAQIHPGKRSLSLTEVTTAIQGEKSEKAAGEFEIRPEMLKSMN